MKNVSTLKHEGVNSAIAQVHLTYYPFKFIAKNKTIKYESTIKRGDAQCCFTVFTPTYFIL